MPEIQAASNLLAALVATSNVLNRSQVRYALVGGLAVSFRGKDRLTADVDLLVDVPQLQLPPLLTELQAVGCEFNYAAAITEFTQHGMLQLQHGGVAIDWLKPMLPCLAHVIQRASRESWRGTPVMVAQPEDLIVMKLLAQRTQDLADIEMLLAINQGRLDLDIVRRELEATIPGEPVQAQFEDLVGRFYTPQP